MKMLYHNHKHKEQAVWGQTNKIIEDLNVFLEIECRVLIANESPAGYSHILFHSPSRQKELACQGTADSLTKDKLPDNNCLIFFMSSAGCNLAPSTIEVLGRRWYVFGIKRKPQNDIFLSGKEWQALFTWAKELSEVLNRPDSKISLSEIKNKMSPNIRSILCGDELFFLPTLSILCQGYLVAHGEGDFGISDDLLDKAKNNIDKTQKRDWWKPALGKEHKGDELLEELEVKDKDNVSIKGLIKAINDDDKAGIADKMGLASTDLKRILN
jgi:hypothetical protein